MKTYVVKFRRPGSSTWDFTTTVRDANSVAATDIAYREWGQRSAPPPVGTCTVSANEQ